MLNTPVAFLIFNRPNHTKIAFEAIASARPAKLLVIADGPRFPEEAETCEKTREIIRKVDWDCEVITNFSEKNLGCKNRVSSGLNWVFSQVEEAIIIEDDCVPNPTFFSFCEVLLERYREDTRIMHIGGNNFQFGKRRSKDSYYFSKYSHVWGWATWRRAWEHYDGSIGTWPNVKEHNLFSSFFETKYEKAYWSDIFDKVLQNQIDSWAYPWLYTCWFQNGLSIIPEKNLVSNIGFGEGATHTTTESPFANMPTFDMFEITHPTIVCRHRKADLYTFEKHFGGKAIKRSQKFHRRVIRKIRFQTKRTINSLRTFLQNS